MKNTQLQHATTLAIDTHRGAAPKHTHSVVEEDALVTVLQIARLLNVHPRTAQRWTRNKQIPHYRIGKSVRYSPREVLAAASSV